jgi:hypothetical protein
MRAFLVSDVRLYHVEEVIVGRRAGDAAARLAAPIEAARAQYRRRFPGERETRIFEEEVRRIIVGADPDGAL